MMNDAETASEEPNDPTFVLARDDRFYQMLLVFLGHVYMMF